MAASQLGKWFAAHGRHDLPWRQTRDPWPVLVSEIMLQQTSVARVLEPWQRFMRLWPTPGAMAHAELADVLREWKGLGYPRRARALRECAQLIDRKGWLADEVALRRLPGIGEYTARALLCFAMDPDAHPPRDVNIARVAARAWSGSEAHQVPPSVLDELLRKRRPRDMNNRDYAFTLFDIGASLCTARSVNCGACPLRRTCKSRRRLASGVPGAPRRQAPYAGSFRELRGAVLQAVLSSPGSEKSIQNRLTHLPQAKIPGALESALESLRKDRLIPPGKNPRG